MIEVDTYTGVEDGGHLYRSGIWWTLIQEPVSERCCWEATTGVESCVKMVLSARHNSVMLRRGHSHLMASDSSGFVFTAQHSRNCQSAVALKKLL